MPEDRYAAQAKQKARQKALWTGYKIQAGTAMLDNVVAYAQEKCSVRIREETKIETFTPRKEMDAYDMRAMARRLATENNAEERFRHFQENYSNSNLYESAMENAEKVREEAGRLKTGHDSYLSGNKYVETYTSAAHSRYDSNFYYSELQEDVNDYYSYGSPRMSSYNRYDSELGVPDLDGQKNDRYSGYGEDVVRQSPPPSESGFSMTAEARSYDDDPTAGMDFGKYDKYEDYAPTETMSHETYGYERDDDFLHTYAEPPKSYSDDYHDDNIHTSRNEAKASIHTNERENRAYETQDTLKTSSGSSQRNYDNAQNSNISGRYEDKAASSDLKTESGNYNGYSNVRDERASSPLKTSADNSYESTYAGKNPTSLKTSGDAHGSFENTRTSPLNTGDESYKNVFKSDSSPLKTGSGTENLKAENSQGLDYHGQSIQKENISLKTGNYEKTHESFSPLKTSHNSEFISGNTEPAKSAALKTAQKADASINPGSLTHTGLKTSGINEESLYSGTGKSAAGEIHTPDMKTGTYNNAGSSILKTGTDTRMETTAGSLKTPGASKPANNAEFGTGVNTDTILKTSETQNLKTSGLSGNNGAPLKTGNPSEYKNEFSTLKTAKENGGQSIKPGSYSKADAGLKTGHENLKDIKNGSLKTSMGTVTAAGALKTGEKFQEGTTADGIVSNGDVLKTGAKGIADKNINVLKTGQPAGLNAESTNGLKTAASNAGAVPENLKASDGNPLKTAANSAAGKEGVLKTGALNVNADGVAKNTVKTIGTGKVGTIVKDKNGKIIGITAPDGTVTSKTAIIATSQGTGKFFIVKTAKGTFAVDINGNMGRVEGGKFIESKNGGLFGIKTAKNSAEIKTAKSERFGGVQKVGFSVKSIGKTAIHTTGEKFTAIGKAAKKFTGKESWMELTGNFFSAKTEMPLAVQGPAGTMPVKSKKMIKTGNDVVKSKGKKAIVLRTKAAKRKGILDQFTKKKDIKGGFVVANNMEEFVKFKNKKKVIGIYTAEKGFASIKDGKINTASGTVLATSAKTSKGILGTLKTKEVTVESDGKVIKKIVRTKKEGSSLFLKTARGTTKVLKTAGKGAAVAGTFTSFMQGVEAGDTKSWTVAQGKKFVARGLRRAAVRLVQKMLKIIKELVKKVISLFIKLLAACAPVAIALVCAACVFCIFGFLAEDKKTWDNYSDFIVSTTEHLQSDASSCSSVEITGRDTIDWKGVFSITEGFYDGESDTKNVKPVLAWFKGNSDTGVLSKIKNTIFNGGFGTTNHMYKFSSDGGNGTIHIYNYNDMLKAFVKSKIWKKRIGDAETPDLEPYEFRLDDSYSTTLDVGSAGSEGDADISDAESLIDGGSEAAKKFVEFALKQRGKPYVWGATGPNSFDCSGLVYYCIHSTVDPHYSRTDTRGIASNGWKTIKNFSDLKTGDVLVFSSNGGFGGIHHVGIYIGSGKMVHAPHTGDVVKISDVTHGYYRNQFYCGKRPFKDE